METDDRVFMWAFDLIELNGIDLRRDPIGKRKAKLAAILARAAPGLRFNEHLDQEDGPLVFHPLSSAWRGLCRIDGCHGSPQGRLQHRRSAGVCVGLIGWTACAFPGSRNANCILPNWEILVRGACEVISALASGMLYLSHPTFAARVGTSRSCHKR
jgi:hypothetical protein